MIDPNTKTNGTLLLAILAEFGGLALCEAYLKRYGAAPEVRATFARAITEAKFRESIALLRRAMSLIRQQVVSGPQAGSPHRFNLGAFDLVLSGEGHSRTVTLNAVG